MITRTKKKEPKSHISRLRWRRVWDSNPRDVAVKQFSRLPRYDRFDNPPYIKLLERYYTDM